MNKTLAKPQKSTTFTDFKALVPFIATEKKTAYLDYCCGSFG